MAIRECQFHCCREGSIFLQNLGFWVFPVLLCMSLFQWMIICNLDLLYLIVKLSLIKLLTWKRDSDSLYLNRLMESKYCFQYEIHGHYEVFSNI